MNKQDELNYERGSRSAWLTMIVMCLQQLGYSDPVCQGAAWIKEREETIAALRSACEQYGDNEWPDGLNLADVVNKHLVRNDNYDVLRIYSERVSKALLDLVNVNWTFIDIDADTENPDILHNRILRGRDALGL